MKYLYEITYITPNKPVVLYAPSSNTGYPFNVLAESFEDALVIARRELLKRGQDPHDPYKDIPLSEITSITRKNATYVE